MIILGFSGAKRAGKNTVASLVEQHYFAQGKICQYVNFADALRSMMSVINPIVDFSDNDAIRYNDVVREVGYENSKKVPEIRRLLQVTGTEAVRDILGPDTWVNKWADQVSASTADVVLTCDVRFINEYDALKELGGNLWRIDRPGLDIGDSHSSERDWQIMKWDKLIINNDPRSELPAKVDAALHEC